MYLAFIFISSHWKCFLQKKKPLWKRFTARLEDYQGHSFWKDAVKFFECKFSMLWAQQMKFLSPSLYCGGSGNLRDRYLKSWQINTKPCVWPDITRGKSENIFSCFFFVNWVNQPFNTHPPDPNTATSKAPLCDFSSLVHRPPLTSHWL